MRQVTATEKYNAVLEGKMAKKEFVRQMRQTYPMYISQYDGFDSTVQILKNRQMIFEAQKPAFSGVKVYDDRPALTYSLDALDRGIRIELGVMGIDMAERTVKPEEFKQAEKKAKDNLEKDANHYVNLMAGESNKVDKHDKEKEVKRGAADKDTFNDMKKATLKEGYTEEQISSAVQRIKERRAGEHEDGTPKSNDEMGDDEREEFYNNLDSVKERLTEKLSNPTLLAAVKQIKAMHPEVTSGIVDDFIDMHGQDILDGADPMDEFHNYIDANYEGPSDFMNEEKELDDVYGDGDVVVNISGMSPGMKAVWEIEKEISEFGDSNDAQLVVDNMIEINSEEHLVSYLEDREIDTQTIVHMVKAYNSASVTEKKGKDLDGDGDVDGDDYMHAKDKAIKKAMGKGVDEIGMFHDPRGYDKNAAAEDKRALELIKAMINKGVDRDTAIEKAGEKFGLRTSYLQKKMSKDPREEQLKEAIKSIIKKTLLNEAATVKLADWAEAYETFPGVKPVVNELENIVTEIETFYDKMSDKIAKVFEKTANFENEEGLKIGGFIAPGLESAFGQDLSKVIKKGSFFSKINLPKVRTITQADVDAHNSGERPLGETDIIEEPKSTIFTPNF